MKLLIACDMEGISGVVNWNQVDPSHAEYQRFRHIMTADVNAAIRGAAQAGVDDIQIADGHWNSGNVLIEELDPRARLSTGTPSPFSMVQGVQHGVDAVFFVGYHARIGTPNAILDHTWSSARVANAWINGRIFGETGLNAAVCGAFNAPVLLVTGDQSVGAEARDWLPGVATVAVKQAVGRTAALCLPLEESRRLISEAAAAAVERWRDGKGPQPLRVSSPVTIGIEFNTTLMADQANLLPGATRVDGRKIEFTASDMPAAYLNFRAAINLVSA